MASINRVGTFSLQQRTLFDVGNTQSRLFDLQRQISSGLKTSDFQGLSGQVEQFTNLESKVASSKQYTDNNQLIISRIQTTTNSLSQIVDIAEKVRSLVLTRRNESSNSQLTFGVQVTALQKQIAGALNTNLGGRFLFSGTRTDVQPVADTIPDPVTDGVPDAGYYQGSAEDMVVRAQDNVELTYNVRADNSAFQKLFAGISLALKGDQESSDNKLKDAFTLVSEGLEEVIAVQADQNSKLVTLQEINEKHDAQRLYFQGLTEALSRTDIVEASSQVALDQAVLTASFQVFARINSLRLSDFLQ